MRLLLLFGVVLMSAGCWDSGNDPRGNGVKPPDNGCTDCANLTDAETMALIAHTPRILCSDRLGKSAAGSGGFVERAAAMGINHSHVVSDELWQQYPDSHAMYAGLAARLSVFGDCWDDLVFSETPGSPLVFYVNQSGQEFEAGVPSLPSEIPDILTSMLAVDLTGNYLDDVVFSSAGEDSAMVVHRKPNNLDFSQRLPSDLFSYGLSVGDYDADGVLDLYVGSWSGLPSQSVFKGAAGGNFQAASDETLGSGALSMPSDSFSGLWYRLEDNAALGLAGRQTDSAVVASQSGVLSVVFDAPDMNIQAAHGLITGDFSGSGREDMVLSGVVPPEDDRQWPWGGNGPGLFVNNGAFSFSQATADLGMPSGAFWQWGGCSADFNNNGHLDIFIESGFGHIPEVVRDQLDEDFLQAHDAQVVGYEHTRPLLFINQGDGSFVEMGESMGLNVATNGRQVVCSDIDRDGDVDIVVAQNSGPALLFDNTIAGQAGANFISVHLLAPPPNTSAIGATARIRTGTDWQSRQVIAASGFAAGRHAALHFGLGFAELVDEIEVVWPDGEIQQLGQIPANRFVRVRHPDFRLSRDAAAETDIADVIASAEGWLAGLEAADFTDDALVYTAILPDRHRPVLAFDARAEFDSRINELLDSEDEADNTSGKILSMYRRVYDSSQLWQAIPAEVFGDRNALLFAGLFCADRPLPENYTSLLGSAASATDAEAIIALVSLWWATDNDCPVRPSLPVYRDMLFRVKRQANLGVPSLDGYEAMVWLSVTGREDLVQSDRLQLLLSDALPAGGWKRSLADAGPDVASTMLAIWFLKSLGEFNHSHDYIVR